MPKRAGKGGDVLGRFDTFGWGELISLIAVVISFATIATSLVSRSKKNAETDTKNEQKIFDKLDQLSDMTRDTNIAVKEMSKKIDNHAERLARIEADKETIFRRLKRIEETQDHCQACRLAKQTLETNGG